MAVLAVVTSWNAFLLPLVVLSGADQWTLPLGVTNFTTQYTSDTARILAFTVAGDGPRPRLLRDRRASAHRWPDQRRGEGLMTATTAPYRDPSLSIDTRIADLLGRMTLDEKLAQLGSAWSFQLIDPAVRLDPDQADRLLRHGLGHVTRVAGASNLDAADVARAGNEIQRYLLEETRLGIPALLHEETLHGLLARDAPSFQQSIGRRPRPSTRSWSGPWPRRSGGGCWRPAGGSPWRRSSTSRATHAGVGSRRPTARTRTLRWSSACAYVRGLQGEDIADGVVATGKHMVGHGLAEGGLNQAPVHIGPRELRDEQLLPFEAAVRVAGLAAMMPAYCDVDGVPCHVSSELLTTLLRGEWGFDGLVVSDYTALNMLMTEHRLTPDLGDGRRDGAACRGRCRVAQHRPRTASRCVAPSRRAPSTRRSSTRPSRGRCG